MPTAENGKTGVESKSGELLSKHRDTDGEMMLIEAEE
jgi:hypothetical protein